MMNMNPTTGRQQDNLAGIRTSIHQILMTPIGSRVMRRSFGSYLPRLVDQPLVGPTTLLIYAAAAMAIMQHEERVILSRFALTTAGESAELLIEGVERESGAPLNITIPLVQVPT